MSQLSRLLSCLCKMCRHCPMFCFSAYPLNGKVEKKFSIFFLISY
nr:MAG TPA: hypothetical protein [Caudoviricetes sp.]